MQLNSCSRISGRNICLGIKLLLMTALTMVLMTGSFLAAQQSDGTLTGLVSDAHNAVISGAKITVSNDDGTFKTETVTGRSGIYTVPSLPPGKYTVHIEMIGFEVQDIVKIPVVVGTVATADATLKVGSANVSVTVTDAAPLLTPGSPTLTTTIDQDMTVDLPFSEPTTLGVAMFAPGVTGEPGAADGVGSELLLMSYPRSGVSFSADAIRSVTDLSAGMPAQYGRAGGGIINQASAAGTDRYHGALRWRHRDPLFEVVTPGSGAAPPAEHLNLFTIAASGPVPLPFWKHHTYFLVAVEPLRDYNAAIGLPPTLAGFGFASFAFGNNVLQDGETGAATILNESYGFGDDVSVQKGRHTIKFGLNYRALQLNQASRNSEYGGAFGSTNGLDGGVSSTGATLTGSATAAYILGEFSTYTVAAPKTYSYRWKYGAAYMQDDWRVAPRLTLNFGLRYNIEIPRMEKYDYQGSFTPNGMGSLTNGGVTYSVPGGFAFSGTNGLPHTLWPTNYHGFEPRLGFGYQATRFMTVRAAYALMHAPLTGLGINVVPNLTSASSANTGLNGIGGTNPNYYVNLVSNPIAAGPNPPVPPFSGALTETWNGTTYLPYVRDQSTHVPYVQLRSLFLQFQVTKGTLIETDYVGNKGTHLYSAPVPTNDVPVGSATTPGTVLGDIAAHLNLTTASKTGDCCGNSTTLLQRQRPFPQFSGNPIYSAFDRYASSNYNAFYRTGRQQAAFGFTFIGSFSWSKSMDDGSSSNGGPGDVAADSYGFANPQGYSNQGDYSLSMYDIPVHLSTGYVWQVPFGRGKKYFGNTPRWLDELVGGWTTSGTQIFPSGYPLFIIASSSGTSTGYFVPPQRTPPRPPPYRLRRFQPLAGMAAR